MADVVPTPPEHWAPTAGRAAARTLLGCDDAILDLLVEEGLSCLGSGDDRWFDHFDLVNVALAAGLGGSVPEAAQRFLLRYAAAGPGAWTAGGTWAVRWSLSCADPRCSGGSWWIAPPVPQMYGGSYDGPGPVAGELTARGAAAEVRARVTTAGLAEPVRSATARRLFGELLGELETGRLRYQWLPAGLRRDVVAAVRNRTLDCVAAALLLEERGRAAGLETRTRQGRMLGIVAVEHAWMEFLDDDGRWRPLDPILALLAGDDSRFRDFCAGSVPGLFLPWDRPAAVPLASHTCSTGNGEWSQTFAATPVS